MKKKPDIDLMKIRIKLYSLIMALKNHDNLEKCEKELPLILEEIKKAKLNVHKLNKHPSPSKASTVKKVPNHPSPSKASTVKKVPNHPSPSKAPTVKKVPNHNTAKTNRSLSEHGPAILKKNSSNEQYELEIKNNHNHRVKVSIIMPTYNKYHQLSLSLYGLSKQTFSPIDYEVILVDDCSTDQTPILFQETDVPFKLKYIRLKKNKGRSFTRNIGIKHSDGDVLIFLDGEMLVPPKFIENHYRHHIEKKNVAVTGAMHYQGLYTFIFPEYNTQQWIALDDLVKKRYHYLKKYEEYNNSNEKKLKVPYQLVTKDDIDKEIFKVLSFPNRYFLNSGVKHFENNLNEFKLPYIAFLTGNVSVRKEHLDKVGYFDESFVGYGAEDWELGYRLYKNGLQFVLDPLTVAYHQEHPKSTEQVKEQWGNHYRLAKKHPNIDILILALEWRGFSFMHIHQTLVEYEQLPKEYDDLKNAFQMMLFKVIENLNEGKPVTRLYESWYYSEEKMNIQQQFSKLRPLGFDYLASSFEHLYLL